GWGGRVGRCGKGRWWAGPYAGVPRPLRSSPVCHTPSRRRARIGKRPPAERGRTSRPQTRLRPAGRDPPRRFLPVRLAIDSVATAPQGRLSALAPIPSSPPLAAARRGLDPRAPEVVLH